MAQSVQYHHLLITMLREIINNYSPKSFQNSRRIQGEFSYLLFNLHHLRDLMIHKTTINIF